VRAKPTSLPDETGLELPIFTIRGQRVILDADLAHLYGVATHVFNQAIKRNRNRFPEDFAFRLTVQEMADLRSQIVISSAQHVDGEDIPHLTSRSVISSQEPADTEADGGNSSQPVITPNWPQSATSSWRSQVVTTSAGHGGRRYRPWAFTEHGALMAANVLRSARAVQMSVYVVRAFVRMREHLAANTAILKRLAEIDRTLLEHDEALRVLWAKLEPLLRPAPEPRRRRIGFRGGKA
jgi:hypothetical protein